MIEIIEKSKCSGCKACYNICPNNCIDMIMDEEGFWYPKVDKTTCIQCDLCEKICPELNVYNNDRYFDRPIVLAAWNKDENKRRESSSGGIFTSIAEWIISNDGVVFGAGFDDAFNVIHKEIVSFEGLEDLRGSKYVQSDINETYRKAKYHLENNKSVLFTGTPCQVAGLHNYLGRDYANLYTCDLVCHGVPSPKVFDKYKKTLEQQHESNIQRIAFRHKKYGWKLFSVSLKFFNDTEYSKTLREDPYMLGFLRNYYLRPSCYTCTYARLPRTADITLGDYWGVANKYPELDDDKGTSLLLVNSERGKYILENCMETLSIHDGDLDYAIRHNPCIIKPVDEPEKRQKFFKDFNSKDFKYVIKKYMSPPSLIETQIIFIKRALNFIKRRMYKFLSIDNEEKDKY